MNEMKSTLTFLGIAIVLALIAFLSVPDQKAPDAFFDVGEDFYPEFTDPNEAVSLEVIDFDEDTGEAIPFKVEFTGKYWHIPSHYSYPADGKDRLAKTAVGVIGIKKDDFRTDNVAEHESCKVIDPLDESVVALKGRGKRITLKGKNNKVLADFILGREIEGVEGYRFVRVPGQKRVYAAKVDIDLSVKFTDWIESDLLKVTKDDVEEVVLKDYSINEGTRAVMQRDTLSLTKAGEDWSADKMAADQEVDMVKMSAFLTALDELSIVDVRRKPEGLSGNLKRVGGDVKVSQSDALSLQSKGYYFSSNGQLLSNEGELSSRTKDGVKYILRFGEVVTGGDQVESEADKQEGEKTGSPAENRYLFITTEFVPTLFPEPEQAANLDFQNKDEKEWSQSDHENKRLHDIHEEWRQQVEKGLKLSNDLNGRFANWYYVISSASFDALHLTRADLIKEKEKPPEDAAIVQP